MKDELYESATIKITDINSFETVYEETEVFKNQNNKSTTIWPSLNTDESPIENCDNSDWRKSIKDWYNRLYAYQYFNDKDYWELALKNEDKKIRLCAYQLFNDIDHWEIALNDINWVNRLNAYKHFNDRDHWNIAINDKNESIRSIAKRWLNNYYGNHLSDNKNFSDKNNELSSSTSLNNDKPSAANNHNTERECNALFFNDSDYIKRLEGYDYFNDKDHWKIALNDEDYNIRLPAYLFFNDKDHWEKAINDEDYNIRLQAYNYFNDIDHWNIALKDEYWIIRIYAYNYFNDKKHWKLALSDDSEDIRLISKQWLDNHK